MERYYVRANTCGLVVKRLVTLPCLSPQSITPTFVTILTVYDLPLPPNNNVHAFTITTTAIKFYEQCIADTDFPTNTLGYREALQCSKCYSSTTHEIPVPSSSLPSPYPKRCPL